MLTETVTKYGALTFYLRFISLNFCDNRSKKFLLMKWYRHPNALQSEEKLNTPLD